MEDVSASSTKKVDSPIMILSEAPSLVNTRSTGVNWQELAGTNEPCQLKKQRKLFHLLYIYLQKSNPMLIYNIIIQDNYLHQKYHIFRKYELEGIHNGGGRERIAWKKKRNEKNP